MVARSFKQRSPSDFIFMRTEDEMVYETSLESFPASDPPAWVFGRDLPPPSESEKSDSSRPGVEQVPLHILESALSAFRNTRSGRDATRP
jgi:hypothetical protein